MAEVDSPLELEHGDAQALDPDRVGDELPDNAEWIYLGAFMAAKEAYEDEQEGAWYAAAWDVVNDLYEKPEDADEDERVDWELKESKQKALAEKVESIIEGKKKI